MGIFTHKECGMNHGRPMKKGESCDWPKQSKQAKQANQSKKGK